MARRRSPSPKHWERHPGVYAKTNDTWTTRYYNRKQDPILDMLGLDTASDDFHKREGSSPYLSNVRYMGERETSQRAQVMSRSGARKVAALGEAVFDRPESDGDSYLDIYEGKVLEWEITHTRLLTGLSLHLQNVGNSRGALYLRVLRLEDRKELASAIIDLETVDDLRYRRYSVDIINAVPDTRVIIQAQVIDDFVHGQGVDETGEKRRVRILSTVNDSHREAEAVTPNVDDALKEQAIDFNERPLAPVTGVTVTDWEALPKPEEFRYDGNLYIAFPVRFESIVEIYRTRVSTGETTLLTSNVSNDAEFVRFDQAEGYLYYVDGISPLRRVNLTTLASEDVIPTEDEIEVEGVDPSTLTPKAGASLIRFLSNRIFLSGFRDDPNLVINSLIDSTGPKFTQYADRFYSPDQSPELSSGSKITALTDINNYLIVFRVDGVSLYDYGGGVSASEALQVTPEGAQLGVLSQEAVVKGRNNIYFFNPDEGVCRFAGSVNRIVSNDIRNLLSGIKHKDKVVMAYSKQAVRLYFSFKEEKPDSCLYYYTELEGQLPWYMDLNTPVSGVVSLKGTEDLYATHARVATVMQLDAPDNYSDFDSPIILEYHTQYRVPTTTDPSGWSYVRRIHTHMAIERTHSIYMGIDIDHQNRPAVWRKKCACPVGPKEGPLIDSVFQSAEQSGSIVVSQHCYIKCHKYQLRLKRIVYKEPAEVIGMQVEYGDQKPI